MKYFLTGLTIWATLAFASALRADDSDPLLQINSAGPTAMSRTLLLNRDESLLVAGGDDKVVRIWDTASGALVRQIRGEVGEDIYGAVTAMALSPDDRWLAVAIFYPHDTANGERRGYLRLHDFASGELVRLVDGHRQVLHTLSFSPDGSMLLGGEGSDKKPEAIIWDTNTWQVRQRFQGHAHQIYGAAFTPDARQVVTASWDKSIRVWDVDSGKTSKTIKNGHDGRIYGLVIPTGASEPVVITAGTDESVRFWNYNTGKQIRKLDMGRKIRQLAVDPAGGKLLAASIGTDDKAWIDVIDVRTGKATGRYDGHDRFSVAMTFSRDNDTVFSSGGFRHEIDRWSAGSTRRMQRIASDGLPVQAVGIAADGNRLYWGHDAIDWGKQKFDPDKLASLSRQIDLNTIHNQLGVPQKLGDSRGIRRALHRDGDLSVKLSRSKKGGMLDLLTILRKGKTLGSIKRDNRSGHLHSAYTLTPDGKHVISGAEVGYLTLYDIQGNKVGDFKGHNDLISDLAVSDDSKLLVSASRDQTFRLWNIDTREMLVSFFVAGDGEWIAWTTTGHYTSSPNGDRHIGWVINQGPDRNALYVLADQMKQQLYRPDIIRKVLANRGLDEALEASPKSDFSVAQVQEKKVIPVDFTIRSPAPGFTTEADAINLEVELTRNADSDVQWAVTVNDRQVLNQIATRGLARTQPKGKTLTFPVILDTGENRIRVVADNNETEKEMNLLVIRNEPQVVTKGVSGHRLLVISVGVNSYANMPEQNLRFASADAQSLAEKFIQQEGKNYDEVESIILSDHTNAAPNRDNIVDALDKLAELGPTDTVILFLAGHGVVEDDTYYFLPRDATLSGGSRWKKSTVVAWSEIQRAMQNSLGRRILLVDTCYSANAFNSRLVKDAEDSDIIVMTSTDSSTLAQELSSLGHGVFTYALVTGIEGEADSFEDGKVTMTELNAFVANKVPSITRNTQIPTLSVPGGFKDFVVVSL